MISQHLGKALSEERRARWVELITLSAQEAGSPGGPRVPGSVSVVHRVGITNRVGELAAGGQTSTGDADAKVVVGCDATPGSRVSALETEEGEATQAIELPAAGEPISFEQHIKPLFRERDRKSMKFAFDLWSYDDVRANAEAILERVKAGTMPCDGAWPREWVEVFERWTQAGLSG